MSFFFQSAPTRVYNAAKANIGQHLTLDPSVSPDVGCAEALSYVLHQAGYTMPPKGIPGVNAMIAWMLGKGFREVTVPLPGTIITAHNPVYTVTSGAHIGVVMRFGICSNTSATGHWDENYTINSWRKYYQQLGSETRFFVPV